jgi:hypothetical protein
MSTSVNEWCIFKDIQINCLGSIGGYMFAGTESGRVLLLFTQQLDGVAYLDYTSGTAIGGVIVPAYSDFGAPALNKQFMMCRASFLAESVPGVFLDIAVDYQLPPSPGSVTFSPTADSSWGTGLWGTALWGGGLEVFSSWVTVSGVGFAGTVSMTTAGLGGSIQTAVNYMVQAGGPL